ncbi:hypothetical protein L0U85_00650 [Glycomyces sp. L485]|uniref:hypothetical protein n=1 Tax=Glycomyces sp. L485 TaxID=2909235 RepID=UPI001F4AB957|nr:hypothetical protein [Glycomyces sp. L485]MCH7229378.1 hypothetical protein [Glycomyces sp. L485]
MRYEPAKVYRDGASVAVEPGAGLGMLDVFVCTNGSATGAGVLLVDGDVVGAGDGRYQVELAPGEHRLEVQGSEAATWAFSVAAGERVYFTSAHAVAIPQQPGFRVWLYQVEDDSCFFPAVTRKAARSASLGCLLTVAGLIAVMVAAVWAASTGSRDAETVAALAVVLSAVGLVTGVAMGVRTAQRMQRDLEASRVGTWRRADSATCLRGEAVAFPSTHDLHLWPAEESGVSLVFDLLLYRVARASDGVAYSGSGASLALAHAGEVRLRIDGVEVPCDWSVWFYPLTTGIHVFRVEYGPDAEGDAAVHEFTLDVGETATVHVPVRAFRVFDESTGLLSRLTPRISHYAEDQA